MIGVAHDAAASTKDPVLVGCYSSAAAPTDVSADIDAVRAWCLRNGALAIQPTFAGILWSTGNGTAGTGTPRVTIASDNTAFPVNATLAAETTKVIGTINIATGQSLAANQSVNVAQINGVTPLMGGGNTGTGSHRVTLATDQATLTNTFGNVGNVPITAGGLSTFRRVSTADTNIANVKASAGQLYSVQASNVNAAARYLHVYNNAGSPTCNTSIINTWIIPGNTAGAGTNMIFPTGIAFATGIAICVTTAPDGTGSVAASEIVLNLQYK